MSRCLAAIAAYTNRPFDLATSTRTASASAVLENVTVGQAVCHVTCDDGYHKESGTEGVVDCVGTSASAAA